MQLLTPEAGKYLSDELQSKIHTGRYRDAYQMVDDMLRTFELKDKPVLEEPWLRHVRKLEARIDTLEKQLAKKETTPKVLTAKK